jgi:acetyl-CoA carboxylase biotin carboxyl carrier protein
VNLSNDDVQDILRLLDTLPYGEFVLETSQFTLRLRRAEGGVWAQELTVLTEPVLTEPVLTGTAATGTAATGTAATGTAASSLPDAAGAPAASRPGAEPPGPAGAPAPPAPPGAEGLHEVRAALPGTFYRAPNPGAPPFVEVGAEVAADTVVAIIETMKLMNPVYPGLAGTVAEICLADGEFAPQDTVLLRVSARAG